MDYTLTTPLYYVNDKPHLGSTYTTIASDALARFNRLEGNNVIFITGVDEHGQKIQRTAEKNKIKPAVHCDVISKNYIDVWEKWQITNDRFIRTTSDKHRKVVEQFFQRVENSGDIEFGRQKGWYCVDCEEFKEELDDPNSPTCEIHKKKLEWRDEENLFFKLSRYQSQIEELVNKPDFIFPTTRRNEVKRFVESGLHDFSISRVNVSWGIPVPGHKGHTFYVWFDALVGYLTALIDEGSEDKLDTLNMSGWPASVHIIGKDILRFHAVYWPAMLISAGLPTPMKLYGHGFLKREGQKMGKSLGNVLDPNELIKQYDSDLIRWYLLKDIRFGQDGDFQHKRFVDLVNNDLANTIGNLLNRTSSMSRKWFDNCIPQYKVNDDESNYLKEHSLMTILEVKESMKNLRFSEAAESILKLATTANIYLNDTEPWSRIKDPTNYQLVANDIYLILETARIIGILLQPIVPNISNRILTQLGVQIDRDNWNVDLTWGLLEGGKNLVEPSPIVQKIDHNL